MAQQPGLEFGSTVLRAWMEGRQLRQAKEEFDAKTQEAQARREQEQGQFQEQHKLAQEQLKQRAEIEKNQLEFQKNQLTQQANLAKARDITDKLGMFQKAQQFRQQYGNGPKQDIPIEDLGTTLQVPMEESAFPGTPFADEYKFTGPMEGFEEKKLRQNDRLQNLLMGSREEIAAGNAQQRMQQAELLAAQKAESDRLRADTMLALGAMRQGQGQTSEEGMEQLIQQGMSGAINVDKLSAKTRERLMIESGKRGVFIQPEKFKEDSKKLSETANFINLVRKTFKSDPKDFHTLGSSVALLHALNQQVGTLGALFPALGRLSDNDIKILREGLPTEKSFVLKKVFPKFSAEYYGGLENALVAGLAKRVEAHLANVTNPEEKHRLTTQYNLYTPGMENYITRRQ